MATLLDALSQENLDNQREVVKNEKRWSYDNRPYGSFQEKLQGHLFPPEHPLPPLDDRLDGRPRRGLGRGRQRLLPDLLRAEQRGPVGRRRRRRRRRPCAGRERYFGGDPGRTRHPAARRPVAAADARRRAARDRSPTGCRCRASTSGSGRPPSATRGSTRSTWPARSCRAARAAGSTGGSSATSGSPRTSRSSRSGSSAARRSARGLGDGPARASRRSASRRPSTRSSTGSRPSSSATTSWPGPRR